MCVVCRSTQPVTIEMLEAYSVCDHGYTQNSRAVHFLFNIIARSLLCAVQRATLVRGWSGFQQRTSGTWCSVTFTLPVEPHRRLEGNRRHMAVGDVSW